MGVCLRCLSHSALQQSEKITMTACTAVLYRTVWDDLPTLSVGIGLGLLCPSPCGPPQICQGRASGDSTEKGKRHQRQIGRWEGGAGAACSARLPSCALSLQLSFVCLSVLFCPRHSAVPPNPSIPHPTPLRPPPSGLSASGCLSASFPHSHSRRKTTTTTT